MTPSREAHLQPDANFVAYAARALGSSSTEMLVIVCLVIFGIVAPALYSVLAPAG